MPCERIVYPNGEVGWMCSRGPTVDAVPPCAVCGRDAEFLCDGPAPEGSDTATCDAALCANCTSQTPPLVTIPTNSVDRAAMRFAGGNVHAPIGAPFTASEKKTRREIASYLFEAEPHDYCPRCQRKGAGR